MKKYVINNNEYELIKNYRDAFNYDDIVDKVTDYYESFDYILGDYAYGKVRLKGFNNKSNKNFNEINNYQNIDDYIKKYCAYECRYFILKKVEKE